MIILSTIFSLIYLLVVVKLYHTSFIPVLAELKKERLANLKQFQHTMAHQIP